LKPTQRSQPAFCFNSAVLHHFVALFVADLSIAPFSAQGNLQASLKPTASSVFVCGIELRQTNDPSPLVQRLHPGNTGALPGGAPSLGGFDRL
jgi:hypothetical protein